MGSPVEQAAFASEGAGSSTELLHFRMVTLILKTDFWGLLVSHFPVAIYFFWQAATLATFYSLQPVLLLKNIWLWLDVLQLHTGGRG